MNRVGKQITVAAVLLILFSTAMVLLWRSGAPEPRCDDGILNQDEEGVDCGGVCGACLAEPEELRMVATPHLLATEDAGHVEAFFRVLNPNPQWGVTELPYTVTIESTENDEVLAVREGLAYVLPLEERLVVEQAIPVEGIFSQMRVRVELGEPTFVEPPEGIRDVELTVLTPTFTRNPDEFHAAEIRGVLRNDSPFSYDAIDIMVVVYDTATDEPVSARRTNMRTLKDNERREFLFTWRDPLPLIGAPRLELEAFTNIFISDNFISEFGELREFQRLREE